MIRWKAFPWVLGVALLAISLVAARGLLNGEAPNTAPGGGPAPAPAGSGKLTVVGIVDSYPTTVLPLSAPAVLGMPGLTVINRKVSEGDTVKAGDVLVEFDSSVFQKKQEQAEQKLIAVQWMAVQARAAKDDHAKKIELQKLAIEKAEANLKSAKRAVESVRDLQERFLAAGGGLDSKPFSEEAKAQYRKDNLELQKVETQVGDLAILVGKEKIDLARLEAIPIKADEEKANAEAGAIQAQIDEAKALVESCKLRAPVDGVIEQISAAAEKFMTFGPTSRVPMMYLVPNGARVVRAEVEAEFAHKVEGFLGKSVVICDAHNFNNTYSGVAKRVSVALLPKRFGGDSLVGAPPRALEVTVEITDPAPKGKPPLRPGLPVRVIFGS